MVHCQVYQILVLARSAGQSAAGVRDDRVEPALACVVDHPPVLGSTHAGLRRRRDVVVDEQLDDGQPEPGGQRATVLLLACNAKLPPFAVLGDAAVDGGAACRHACYYAWVKSRFDLANPETRRTYQAGRAGVASTRAPDP